MLPEGIARYLAAEGIVTWDATGPDGNVHLERMPDDDVVDGVRVAVYQYGGPEADTLHGYDEPGLQVKVRGDGDPRTSRRVAQQIYDALHGLSDETLPDDDATVLLACIGVQSGPVSIGTDERGRHEHVVNFRTEIRNTANRS